MPCYIRRGLLGTLFAGGLLALGTTAASAEPGTSGSDGILSGTQITAPITVPVNLGTNSLAILGEATTDTTPVAATGEPAITGPVTTGPVTSGTDGLLSGTQITAPITVPVNLGTNALAILGEATADTTPGAGTGEPATTGPAPTGPETSGSNGLLSGTQITAPITVPVNLGTNSLAILGDTATDTTTPDAGTGEPATTGPAPTAPVTSGSDGLLSGTQITAPITVPVELGSNALAILGDAATDTTTPGAGTAPTPGTREPAPTRPDQTDPTDGTEGTDDNEGSNPGVLPPSGIRPEPVRPIGTPAGTAPSTERTGPDSATLAAREPATIISLSVAGSPERTAVAVSANNAVRSSLPETGSTGLILLALALPLLGAGLVLVRGARRYS